MYVINNEFHHLMANFPKLLRFPCQKGKIRIRYSCFGSGSDLAKKVPDPHILPLFFSLEYVVVNKAFHLITMQAIGVEDLNKFYKSELMARSVIIFIIIINK
jgi:hypothetical protein